MEKLFLNYVVSNIDQKMFAIETAPRHSWKDMNGSSQ